MCPQYIPSASASYVGVFRGRKTACAPQRSDLSRNFLTIAEFDPAIVRVESNDLTAAERIAYGLKEAPPNATFRAPSGKPYTYDFRAYVAEGLVAVEIGEYKDKSKPEEREKHAMAREQALAAGTSFVLATEYDLRASWLISNCERMLGFLDAPAGTPEQRRYASDMMEERAGTPIRLDQLAADVERSLRMPPGDGRDVAWSAVAEFNFQGRLDYPLEITLLDEVTPITVLPKGTVVERSFMRSLLAYQTMSETEGDDGPEGYGEPFSLAGVGLTDVEAELFRRRVCATDAAHARVLGATERTYTDIGKEYGFTKSQVYELLATRRRRGVKGLIPGHRVRALTTPPEVQKAIVALHDDDNRQLTFAQIAREPVVQEALAIANSGRPPDKQIRLSGKMVKNAVTHRPSDPRRGWRGRGEAAAPIGQADGPLWIAAHAVRPFQRGEADTFTEDVITLDNARSGPLSRAKRAVLLDTASRLPMSIVRTPMEFDEWCFRKVLAQSLVSKDALATMLQCHFDYPFNGVFESIVTDRGWAYLSENVEKDMRHLFGTVLVRAAPRHGDEKPRIERSHGSVNALLDHANPATTKSNVVAKGARHPEDEAGSTYDEQEADVWKFVIDVWTARWHDGPAMRDIPRERFRQLAQDFPPRHLEQGDVGRRKLETLLSMVYQACNNAPGHGFSMFDCDYRPQIAHLDRALLRYNPDNMWQAYCHDPRTGRYICMADLRLQGFRRADDRSPLTLADLHRYARCSPAQRQATYESDMRLTRLLAVQQARTKEGKRERARWEAKRVAQRDAPKFASVIDVTPLPPALNDIADLLALPLPSASGTASRD